MKTTAAYVTILPVLLMLQMQLAPVLADLPTRAMSAAEAEVWRVIEDWNAAFAANDAERYFQNIDESIVVLTPSNPYRVEGIVDDRAEFEFGLRQGYSRVSYFEEIAPIIRVYGDTAVATYFSRGYYGPEGHAQMIYLKETNVLRRENGRWRIVHIHISK